MIVYIVLYNNINPPVVNGYVVLCTLFQLSIVSAFIYSIYETNESVSLTLGGIPSICIVLDVCLFV